MDNIMDKLMDNINGYIYIYIYIYIYVMLIDNITNIYVSYILLMVIAVAKSY